VADWGGGVHLLSDAGEVRTWSFAGDAGGFAVPAEVIVEPDHLVVGLWSGAVWRLTLVGDPVLLVQHRPGVQGVCSVGGRLYVCGFDGVLQVYEQGQPRESHRLEPTIWLLKGYPDGPLAVGDQRVWRLKRSSSTVFSERLPLEQVVAVLASGDAPIVIDSQGKGVAYNEQLHRVLDFHTTAGAVPVSCDQSGRHCVIRNPDGARTLLIQGKIGFSHLRGTLAVAPAGDRFALGEAEGIRILDASRFARLVKGEPFDE